MRRNPFFLALLLSAALIAFPACDSGEDDDNGGGNGGGGNGGGGGGGGEEVVGGESSATFSGDRTGTFDGNAYFALVESNSFPNGAFVLIFSDGSVNDIRTASEYFVFIREGAQPAAGEYSLDPDNGSVTTRYFDLGSNQSVNLRLAVESGTLTLTESSDERVIGTFEFAGEGLDPSAPDDPLDISVTGSFDAISVDPSDVDPNFGGF